MNNYIRLAHVIFIFLILLNPSIAFAYKQVVHEEITSIAALRPESKLADTSWLTKSLGLFYPINSDKQKFPNTNEYKSFTTEYKTVIELLKLGAKLEDEGDRAVHHFYDPVNKRPFNILGISLGQTISSPDWILESNGEIGSGHYADEEQIYSYNDARQYLYDALTETDNVSRSYAWGETFRSLGQIVHHIQDMAQPQHVRNDAHIDRKKIEFDGAVYPNLMYDESLYEILTFDWRESSLKYVGYPAVNYATPREFWENDQESGLAQFSNFNFYSEGTIYVGSVPFYGFSSPDLKISFPEVLSIQSLCSISIHPCSAATRLLTGNLYFFSTDIDDNYDDSLSDVNHRALTASLFDADLVDKNLPPTFSLNRFNYAEAQKFLVPRAVAYSTGLLNYFFRGSLEISLPDEKVYAIIDHSDEFDENIIYGFKNIKLKIKNTTETGELTASSGEWLAVAKFHRNICYQPDLTGEYGAAGVTSISCRSPEEEIVVSAPISLPAMGKNNAPVEVSFSFGATPIPINVSDLYLQVVYRGQLGQELDAVMVATKDISEPTFFSTHHNVDQFYYSINNFQKTFKEFFCDEMPYPECKALYSYSFYNRFREPDQFDSENAVSTFDALVASENIPVGAYVRVAILSDKETLPLHGLIINEQGQPIDHYLGYLEMTENQMNVLTNGFEIKHALTSYRGILSINNTANNPFIGDVPLSLWEAMVPLDPKASMIYHGF